MKKAEAIRKVNRYLGGEVLNNVNISFSNVNAAKSVWWLNIKPERFLNDLHILLCKKEESGLIWLKIEGNAFQNLESVFKIRSDKGVVDLEISSDGNRYMCDLKSGGTGYNFRRHIEHKWK